MEQNQLELQTKALIKILNDDKSLTDLQKTQLLLVVRKIFEDSEVDISKMDLPEIPEEQELVFGEEAKQQVQIEDLPIEQKVEEQGEEEIELPEEAKVETLYAKPFDNDPQFVENINQRDEYLEKHKNKFSKFYWYFDPLFTDDVTIAIED